MADEEYLIQVFIKLDNYSLPYQHLKLSRSFAQFCNRNIEQNNNNKYLAKNASALKNNYEKKNLQKSNRKNEHYEGNNI